MVYSDVWYSTIHNQDDCLAINKGSNIVFQRNTCVGGHGISVVRLISLLQSRVRARAALA